MISHLNGGNCSREEHDHYEREYEAAVAAGWTPWDPRDEPPLRPVETRPGAMARLFPRAVGRQVVCTRCGDQIREVAGFDDYCAPCRLREELAVEREAVATGKIQLTGWLGGWSDATS